MAQPDLSPAAGRLAWALTDHQGSVVGMYETRAEGGPNLAWFTYDAHGTYFTLANSNGVGSLTSSGYAGREFDEFTRLYNNRAREYDPATGRFQSPDPLGFAAGDTNLYRYAFNSPTHFTDPSGKVVPLVLGYMAYTALAGMVVANGGYYYAWHESDAASQLAQRGLTSDREAAYQSHITASRYGAAVGDIGISVAQTAPVAAAGGVGLGALSQLGVAGLWSSRAIGAGLLGWAAWDGVELARATPGLDGPAALGAWGGYTASLITAGIVGAPGYRFGRSLVGARTRAFVGRVPEYIPNAALALQADGYGRAAETTFDPITPRIQLPGSWGVGSSRLIITSRSALQRMAGAGIDLTDPGATLPAFIEGETTATSGVLSTNEGRMYFLESGGASPYDLPAAIHVEGKAAIVIRQSGSSGGVVYHNNPKGTCNMCNSNISTLLPEGATLRVVPPAGTVRRSARWYVKSEPYVGNAKTPGLNTN